MGPETPLRVAGPGDSQVVSSLIGSFRDYLEGSSPTDEAIAAAVPGLIDDPNSEFLLAGEPEVGFAQVRFRPSVWTGSDDAWLEDVFVVEEARGEGIGRLLAEGSSDETEVPLRRTMDKTRWWVWLTYLLLVITSYLGAVKPIP